VDSNGHDYSNNVVMASTHDVNYELLDKCNKSYSSARTRDGGAKSYVRLSQHDSSLDAKLGGTSKFTSRRDYQEALAPCRTVVEILVIATTTATVRHDHRSYVLEEQANRNMAIPDC
jgi:hypothetical protein